MTDKQIIIDNVDVSGCPQYCGYDVCKNSCHYFCTPCEWVDIKNCNYKRVHLQLKRKEQECETQQKALELQKSFLDHSERELQQAKQKLEKIKEIINTHKQNRCKACPEFDNCLGHPYCDEVILQIIEE